MFLNVQGNTATHMPNNVLTKKQKSAPPVKSDNDTVAINQTFGKKIFGRLKKYKDDKELLSEQDVVRLAVAKFLESQGY